MNLYLPHINHQESYSHVSVNIVQHNNTFRNIDWKMFFLRILSIQCKIRCDRPTETWQCTCWPPLF